MKEKIVAFRVEDVLWNEIMQYSKEKEISKSKVTREALKKYLSIYKYPFPMILWGYNEFRFALECLNETQLEDLAQISFENGIKGEDYYGNDFLGLKNMKGIKYNAKYVIALLSFTFSSQGQNWFHKFKSIWRKKSVIVYGTHDLGKKFSFYIKLILKKFMERYDYQITKEELRDNLLIIEFHKLNESN
jgi:hypothetical protein